MSPRKGIVPAALATALLLSAPAASADSPAISVFNGGVERCQSTFYSGSSAHFDIADQSADGNYCYVQYDWDSDVDSGGSRFSHPTDYDINTALSYYPTINGSPVYWKLCREIPSGPDNCTSVRSDAT